MEIVDIWDKIDIMLINGKIRRGKDTEIIWLGSISYFDIRQRRIPLWLIVLGLCYWGIDTALYIEQKDIMETGWNIVLAAVFVLGGILIWHAGKGSIGLGDVWLLGTATLLLGAKAMLGSLGIAFFVLSLYAVGLFLRGYSKKTTLPFAPFLLAGVMIWQGTAYL